MNEKYSIFFAIPFDSASRVLYERLSKNIKKRFSEFELTIIFGTEEVGPSPKDFTIATFKTQNQLLLSQFVFQIKQSDVVIADLTNNNPNVHFELGIALMNNKNILRVTGRPRTELGFDIQGLVVHRYNNYERLQKTVVDFLEIFFRIKQLNISSDHGELYWKEPTKIPLRPALVPPKDQGNRFISKTIRHDNYLIRDGAVLIKYKTLKEYTPDNWFGVYFRASYNFNMGSYLLFVRQGGTVELAVYPGGKSIKAPRTYPNAKGSHTLLIEFGDGELNVDFDSESCFKQQELQYQIRGRILVAAWNVDIDVHSVEMICRDTIAWG